MEFFGKTLIFFYLFIIYDEGNKPAIWQLTGAVISAVVLNPKV
jgi:hypothetical protein